MTCPGIVEYGVERVIEENCLSCIYFKQAVVMKARIRDSFTQIGSCENKKSDHFMCEA